MSNPSADFTDAFRNLLDDAVLRTITQIDCEVRLVARGADGTVLAEQKAVTVYTVPVWSLPTTIDLDFDLKLEA